MAGWWLVTLVAYGCINGFASVPALAWLLLIPFVAQDLYDAKK